MANIATMALFKANSLPRIRTVERWTHCTVVFTSTTVTAPLPMEDRSSVRTRSGVLPCSMLAIDEAQRDSELELRSSAVMVRFWEMPLIRLDVTSVLHMDRSSKHPARSPTMFPSQLWSLESRFWLSRFSLVISGYCVPLATLPTRVRMEESPSVWIVIILCLVNACSHIVA